MSSSAGQQLRAIRESLGLTLRDVEAASERLARRHREPEYAIGPSRLSDIESKGVLPTLHRLYALAVIYHRDFAELLNFYGIDLDAFASDFDVAPIRDTHRTYTRPLRTVTMPVALDPGFDPRSTTNIGRMVERWGVLPLSYLESFASLRYSYAYIGLEDRTMYPLLLPGTFVQIDESRNRVMPGPWRSEYERPIYFVETRQGFRCGWCLLEGEQLSLQPHPLSGQATVSFANETEAEVLGQVVGIAMRLDASAPHAPAPRGR